MVVRKIIKKKKHAEHKKDDEKNENQEHDKPSLNRGDSVSTTQDPESSTPSPVTRSNSTTTEPYDYADYYQGGVSQWREYDEDSWGKSYQWPPDGWRPASHHRAYWDPTSEYYKYNAFDWEKYHREQEQVKKARTNAQPQSPTVSEAFSLRSRGSSFVEDQLSRMQTGDQMNFLERLDDVAEDSPTKLKERANALIEQAKKLAAKKQEAEEDAKKAEEERLLKEKEEAENAKADEAKKKAEEERKKEEAEKINAEDAKKAEEERLLKEKEEAEKAKAEEAKKAEEERKKEEADKAKADEAKKAEKAKADAAKKADENQANLGGKKVQTPEEMLAEANALLKKAEEAKKGDAAKGDDKKKDKKAERTEAELKKLEAHARYMRYYRNIRRHRLSCLTPSTASCI